MDSELLFTSCFLKIKPVTEVQSSKLSYIDTPYVLRHREKQQIQTPKYQPQNSILGYRSARDVSGMVSEALTN